MGNLEKYGVCALLFVIVTVLAISIWGPRPARPAGPEPGAKPAVAKEAPLGAAAARLESADAAPRGARPLDGKRTLLGQFEERAKELFDEPPVPVPGTTVPAAEEEPASEAAAPAAVDPRAVRPSGSQPTVYVVQKGDVLETIAREHLGSSTKWREILQWNEGIDPHRLREGQQLVLPPEDLSLPLIALASDAPSVPLRTQASAPVLRSASASSPAEAPAATHTITKGETLYTIAEQYLRSGNRWREIFDANRTAIGDPDRLRVGTVIRIPGR